MICICISVFFLFKMLQLIFHIFKPLSMHSAAAAAAALFFIQSMFIYALLPLSLLFIGIFSAPQRNSVLKEFGLVGSHGPEL